MAVPGAEVRYLALASAFTPCSLLYGLQLDQTLRSQRFLPKPVRENRQPGY